MDVVFSSLPPKNQGARDFIRVQQLEPDSLPSTYKAPEAREKTRETLQQGFQKKGFTTRAAQIGVLITMINSFLRTIRENPQGSLVEKEAVVLLYNFLRELLEESPIESVQEINQEWLREQQIKALIKQLISPLFTIFQWFGY